MIFLFVLFAAGCGSSGSSDQGGNPPDQPPDQSDAGPGTADAAPEPQRGAAGSLDTTFGTNGRLMDFGMLSPANVLVSADDHILVVGVCSGAPSPDDSFVPNDGCIVRLTPDGAVDTTYGNDGIVLMGEEALATPSDAVLLPGGRIGVVGTTRHNLGKNSYTEIWYDIVDVNGATRQMDSQSSGPSIVLAPDGSLILTQTTDLLINKLTNTGEIDTGPGSMTSANLDATFAFSCPAGFSFSVQNVAGVVVRPDGRIVIGGSWSCYNNSSGFEYHGYGIWQLDGSTGAPDPSFGWNAEVTVAGTSVDYDGGPGLLALLEDGRIIAPIRYNDSANYSILAYTDSGPDITFGMTGDLYVTSNNGFPRIFLDNQNRLLVTRGTDGLVLESVSRVTAAGAFDPAFGTGGNAILSLPAGLSSSSGSVAARVQKDGRIVVLSQATKDDGSTVAVVSRLWN